MKKKFLNITSAFLCALAAASCSGAEKIPDRATVPAKFRTSGSAVFNYEDQSKKFSADIVHEHYRLHFEADEPVIAGSVITDSEQIHQMMKIEGTAVYRARVAADGKILSLELVKSAGLGLDAVSRKIAESIRFKPLTWKGSAYESNVEISITFTQGDRF